MSDLRAAVARSTTRTFSSLRNHRNYRLFFAGQFISMSGSWMQDAALAWLVYELTHSPFHVGMLVFIRFAPRMVFTLFAGVWADRFDNRLAFIWTQVASMVLAVVLAAVTLAGDVSLAVVYVLAFIGGAVGVFGTPNRMALIFQLVGREDITNAVALGATLLNLTRVIGPAVAGVVIAAAGTGACFAVNAVTYLAVIAVLLMMRTDELHPLDRGENRPKGIGAIREGLGYVRHEPGIRLIVVMTAVVGIVSFNFRVILPTLTSSTLHAGPDVFGLLYASFGVGAFVGALTAATAPRPTWRRLQVAMAGWGVALVAIAPLHSIPAVVVLLFAAGICFTLWTTTSQSILQLTTPDRLRGRVLSLYWFVFAGLTPIGSILIGWLASRGGSGPAFLLGGLSALAMAAYGAGRMRALHDPVPAVLPQPAASSPE